MLIEGRVGRGSHVGSPITTIAPRPGVPERHREVDVVVHDLDGRAGPGQEGPVLIAPHDLLRDILESRRHEQRTDPYLHRVLGETSGAIGGSHGREGREGEYQGAA